MPVSEFPDDSLFGMLSYAAHCRSWVLWLRWMSSWLVTIVVLVRVWLVPLLALHPVLTPG